MRVLLTLCCLGIFMSLGCKQTNDPFEFDRIVNTAYSSLSNISLLDSASKEAEKKEELKLRNLKKECKKLDSCHSINFSGKIM